MPNKLSQFWQELKRRRVIHVIVVYSTAAFVIIELVNNVYETLNLPEWTPAFTLIVLSIGFPLAIIFSWIYELSSKGIKRTNAVDHHNNAADSLTEKEELTSQEKSIIVLPFENISSDPEQEYFSDGLTEEIITDLSYINDLLVISRSSAMTFKGSKQTIKEIAEKVNVRYVLEGSVRKAGSNLRITAQLIDASNDSHIWSEKYDGTLENVFEIQEKVSKSIAESLRLRLSQDVARHISKPTFKDPVVYELYLKARYENWQFNETSFRNAEDLLNRGLKYAGDNELLYAELCLTNVQYVNNLMKDPFTYKDILTKAKLYAQKAIEIDPDSALSLYSQGMALFQSCNPLEAFRCWKKAITIEPNTSESFIPLLLGYMYLASGLDLNEGMRLLERAKNIDPLTLIVKTCFGWGYYYQGKFQETIDEWSEWLAALEAVNSPMIIASAWSYGLNQDFGEAIRLIDKFVASNPGHVMASLGLFIKYTWANDKKKALQTVNVTIEEAVWWDDLWSLLMAECYAILDEKQKAFRFLNRAIDYGITNVAFYSEYDPFLGNIKSDKRFHKSMERARSFVKSLEQVI